LGAGTIVVIGREGRVEHLTERFEEVTERINVDVLVLRAEQLGGDDHIASHDEAERPHINEHGHQGLKHF